VHRCRHRTAYANGGASKQETAAIPMLQWFFIGGRNLRRSFYFIPQ
jgi:hypothetical protein